MPLKLRIGLSRKIGLSGYPKALVEGTVCGLDVEAGRRTTLACAVAPTVSTDPLSNYTRPSSLAYGFRVK